uniref:Uncharacterized protein n=1 Tax=viral metagenome TaxID=1070528 RepID=A0A6M3LHU3_9ZZZZ
MQPTGLEERNCPTDTTQKPFNHVIDAQDGVIFPTDKDTKAIKEIENGEISS